MGAAENTRDVWDGFVPFVAWHAERHSQPVTVRMHALRVLRERNKLPAIMDAINPGGSGDPYATLNEEECAALKEATLLGYPPRGWWNHDKLNRRLFLQCRPAYSDARSHLRGGFLDPAGLSGQ